MRPRNSVTRKLFLGVYRWAVLWVSWSYAIATYSILVLQQVYTMTELAAPAITVLIGGVVAKVIENSIEHNDGFFCGRSHEKQTGERNGEKEITG